MWRRAWNLSRAKCHWFHVRVEYRAYQHHRKRVDAQINDGEDRSEKKKNEVLSLAIFPNDEFDPTIRCVAARRDTNEASAGSNYAKSLNEYRQNTAVKILWN